MNPKEIERLAEKLRQCGVTMAEAQEAAVRLARQMHFASVSKGQTYVIQEMP